jgi:hypothetical protein
VASSFSNRNPQPGRDGLCLPRPFSLFRIALSSKRRIGILFVKTSASKNKLLEPGAYGCMVGYAADGGGKAGELRVKSSSTS